MKIDRSTTTSSQIDWNSDTILYKSLSFSISDFRAFIHGLTSSTRATLFGDILFENRVSTRDSPIRNIPNIPWKRIFDNPLDSTPFSNFLLDPRTQLGLDSPEKWLFNRIATSPDLASRFSIPGPQLTWNSQKLSDWISNIQLFLEKLLILAHIIGGQPPRAPELASIRYSNSTTTGVRNIFVESGFVYFVTYYHKGYTIQGSTKIIHRFLPREIGELLVYYLWLVVPFLARISFDVFRKPLTEYLFENLARRTRSKASKIQSDRFRTVFRRETLAGLGLSINPSEYRYITIGISRRFLSKPYHFQPEDIGEIGDENDPDYEDEVLDLQAGHSTHVAGLTYARGLLEPSGEIQSLKLRFREASLVCYLLGLYLSLL